MHIEVRVRCHPSPCNQLVQSDVYALGTTVDRCRATPLIHFPAGPVETVLSADGDGELPADTELFVQAWHLDPKGTWSDPAGKGYFMEMPTRPRTRSALIMAIRCSIALYRTAGTEFDGFLRRLD